MIKFLFRFKPYTAKNFRGRLFVCKWLERMLFIHEWSSNWLINWIISECSIKRTVLFLINVLLTIQSIFIKLQSFIYLIKCFQFLSWVFQSVITRLGCYWCIIDFLTFLKNRFISVFFIFWSFFAISLDSSFKKFISAQ